MTKVSLVIFCLLPWASLPAESFHLLPLREIQPRGWMRHQVERDLTSGNLSALDRLRQLGAPVGSGRSRGYGEFEGNYADAFVRNAFLAGHQPSIARAARLIAVALESQQPNGYFGRSAVQTAADIIKDDGELWSQCCFLRAALAYHEYTGDRQCLEAIIKNVNLMIALFEQSGIRYFQKPNDEPITGGARAHGLMYVDVLEKLFQLTGDRRYVAFAKFLYDDYSSSAIKNADNKLSRLLDRELMFQEHAPHVAEHLRVPLFLAHVTDEPAYRQAAENIFYKLERSLSPSRMLVADPRELESVAGNYGSAVLPYEYCAITELLISEASALQKTGRFRLGDDIELLLFNAAQGARFPDGKANAYYAKDSQCEAISDLARPPTFRYQYAALHRIACCNINAPRVLPYYVANLWMKSTDGRTLVAALHGASAVTTTVAGQPVTVVADTDYPFGRRVTYTINPGAPVEFSLLLRTPAWSKQTRVEAPGAKVAFETGAVRVTKTWNSGDVVVLEFDDPVRVNRFINNELFVQKGALIYALGFATDKVKSTEFEGGAFGNYDLKLTDPAEREKYLDYRMPAGADLPHRLEAGKWAFKSGTTASREFPFEQPPGSIEGTFVFQRRTVRAELLPMGSLLLRKVLFEQDK